MQMLDILTLLAAGIVLIVALYWIRFFTGKQRGSIPAARTTARDPHGNGNLAAAYGYDESFSPGASGGKFGPLPLRKKRERKTPTSFQEYDD